MRFVKKRALQQRSFFYIDKILYNGIMTLLYLLLILKNLIMKSIILISGVVLFFAILCFCFFYLKKLRRHFADADVKNVSESDAERIVNAYMVEEGYLRRRSRMWILTIALEAVIVLATVGSYYYLDNKDHRAAERELAQAQKKQERLEEEKARETERLERELAQAQKKQERLEEKKAREAERLERELAQAQQQDLIMGLTEEESRNKQEKLMKAREAMFEKYETFFAAKQNCSKMLKVYGFSEENADDSIYRQCQQKILDTKEDYCRKVTQGSFCSDEYQQQIARFYRDFSLLETAIASYDQWQAAQNLLDGLQQITVQEWKEMRHDNVMDNVALAILLLPGVLILGFIVYLRFKDGF